MVIVIIIDLSNSCLTGTDDSLFVRVHLACHAEQNEVNTRKLKQRTPATKPL